MSDSHINYTNGGVAFVGRDAVSLFRARTLASALRLWKGGIKAFRGATLTHLLGEAGKITGKTYKGTKDIDQAVADIKVWADTMQTALPVIDGRR